MNDPQEKRGRGRPRKEPAPVCQARAESLRADLPGWQLTALPGGRA
jgi:hypothetical protein